jgi:ribonuclease P protein component
LIAIREQGFPRAVRLTRPDQYKEVFADARRVGDTGFTLLVRNNAGQGPRLGLAISKKCARRSVDRQRIKRHIRETFRLHREDMASVDIVVMCRPAVTAWDNAQIRASLERFWARLSTSCANP